MTWVLSSEGRVVARVEAAMKGADIRTSFPGLRQRRKGSPCAGTRSSSLFLSPPIAARPDCPGYAGMAGHLGESGQVERRITSLGDAGRIDGVVDLERCDECGFNGEEWSDAAALSAIAGLPTQFANAVTGLSSEDLLRRPVDGQWSIAEYTDHVREVLFGMRFLLDITLTQPGTDLGESPSSAFESEPRQIHIDTALVGIQRVATSFRETFSGCLPKSGTRL